MSPWQTDIQPYTNLGKGRKYILFIQLNHISHLDSVKVAKMAHLLTDNQIDELKEAFNVFDKQNTGIISVKDLTNLLRIIGHNISAEESKNLLIQVIYTFLWENIVSPSAILTTVVSPTTVRLL